MPVATAGLALQPRIDPDARDKILSAMYKIKVTSPTTDDNIAIAICAGVFGLTAMLLVFAWCNYNYRPIRAKNLTWTTLIYLSTVLWFLGNIPSNGHVRIVGAWSNCKLWIIWFRVFFCYVFATMCIVRFYALDRVFNQKKPFTVWSSLISGGAVIVLNVAYCLVNQLISGSLTIEYVPSLEVCNVTQAFRIAALTFMWIIWAAVGVLFFRLRNIQSTFNEFYESIAIFAVIIGLLIESSITNLYYIYYILEKRRRIQKTVVDMAAANLVIWLFIGYPVFMCIFRREKYEQQWLEKLAQDSPNHAFNNNNITNNGTSYAKMNDNFESTFYNDQRLGSMDMSTLDYNNGHHPFSNNSHPLNIESALNGEPIFDGNALPSAMRNNLHIQRPEMNPPVMFATAGYMGPNSNGRHVI
ncbi:hypothetical protein LPJ76_006078 [Coemansia sp. RSA 638]|nr:hypothetical protein LPJ76_006078 [Coemansia sp. RSA 638]